MTFGHNQWLTPNQHVEWLCCESWFKIKFTVLFRLYLIYLFLNWCRLVHKGGHSFSYNYGYSVTRAVWDWVMFNQHLVLEHCQNQRGSTNKTEVYWGELFASYSALVPNHWGRALEQSPCSAQVCSVLAGPRLLMQEIIKSCFLRSCKNPGCAQSHWTQYDYCLLSGQCTALTYSKFSDIWLTWYLIRLFMSADFQWV